MAAPTIIFLDIETTGLNPATDYLLEVAAVAVDGSTLEEIDVVQYVLPCAEVPYNCSDFVRQMHTANGLWRECAAAPPSRGDPLDTIAAFFERHEGAWLAGRNVVGFDKAWLEAERPGICAPLHYRSIDMRTLIRMGEFIPGLWSEDVQPGDSHRALDDARGDAEILRRMVKRLGLLLERFPA